MAQSGEMMNGTRSGVTRREVLQAGPLGALGLTLAGCFRTDGARATAQVPVNSRVAALGDNSWLKLETPKAHPITRSSSPWMAYAPDGGVGLLWGCSAGAHQNDLWTYSLGRNEWDERIQTEPSQAKDPDVFKFKDGVLMTREERPLPSHQWGRMDYDPDRNVLWHMSGGMQSTLPADLKKLKREGDPDRTKGKGPVVFKYDLKGNKWGTAVTEDPSGCTRRSGAEVRSVRYCPALRKLVMMPNPVGPNEAREEFKAYDPDANRWEPLRCEWKPEEDGISPYWVYGQAPVVYDAKRRALVLVLSDGGTWLLDPAKKTCTQVVTREKTPAGNLDGPVGAFVYDSVAETTLCLYVNYTYYGSGKAMAAKGFPTDRANVWALDVEKREWVLQPKPADGTLPDLDARAGCVHHFYDPANNATLVFRGTYNGANGETWVYRYKRATRGGTR